MTTTTMHFGPEWMRTKQGSSRPAPSPPLTTSPAPPGNSTYSALVTPVSNPPPERRDLAHPFRYSKEEMLRIYKEGGGRGGLGLEVERWEGIVYEEGGDPIGLKEMGDAEKKLFAGPLNSEVRRRQSTDFLSPLTTSGLGERPKLNHATSGAGSPMRERIGSFMGRRRGDSTDQAPLNLPRKLSLSNMQGVLASPREGGLPSPRVRPGFDGVLDTSWTARRRQSENQLKAGAGNKSDKETDGENKGSEIKEEEEDALHDADPKVSSEGTPNGDLKQTNGVGGASKSSAVESVTGQLGNLSMSSQGDDLRDTASKPPPGHGDLASIDWSYLDPQGQIQGPFKADLMQRWYNEGYFQPTLMMKRTHLDTEWTSVGELVRRAGDQPVFLSPLVHAVAPPGLSRPLETVVDRAIPERNQHSPYQPVPTRTVRSSTLDSYLQNGSESPSSSFGGRFVNGSPDPAPFENRLGNQVGLDPTIESRIPFATPVAGAIGTPGQRRGTVGDGVDPMYGNRALGMGRPGVDGLGYVGNDKPPTYSETMNGTFGPRTVRDPSVNGVHGTAQNESEYRPVAGMHSNQGTPSRVLNRDPFGKPTLDELQPAVGLGGSISNHSSPFISHAQAFPQTPLAQFAGQDGRSIQSITPISDRQPMPFAQQLHQPFAQSPSYVQQSPWHAPEGPAFRRPGPFDPNHPTANNTFIAQPIASSHSFGRGAPGGIVPEQSSWQNTPQPAANDPWGSPAASLTTANLGQHDAQQRQAELRQQASQAPPPEPALAPAPPTPAVAKEAAPQATPAPAPAASSSTEVVTPQKPRRKSSAQPVAQASQAPKATPAPPVPAPVTPAKPPSPAPLPEPKAPWAVDEDKKVKPSGTTLNLREIQEAEAKKLEARKAAERERERAARATAQADDFQPFTTSWGLPTSQAGSRATPTVKESPAVTPSQSASGTPAVWTNAAKAPAAKKTMKEIQEEEERRKKLAAKEKETIAAAARRAYAETTTKPAAGTPPAVGGAWTTVGSGGKPSAVALVAGRTAVTPAATAKPVPAVTPAAASPAPATRQATTQVARPAAVVLKPTPSKEEAAPGPSLDFLKWLGDSLKGLNSSVNLEEIASMLLTFPLDADASTMEIISELIYAHSTTLDGRRFASEFVSRRKADATARPKGAAAGSAVKPVSIADVVKAPLKPAQNEWGGFKVVNKKKKGGRS